MSPAVFRPLTPVDSPSHATESHVAASHALLATTPPDSPRLGSKLSGCLRELEVRGSELFIGRRPASPRRPPRRPLWVF